MTDHELATRLSALVPQFHQLVKDLDDTRSPDHLAARREFETMATRLEELSASADRRVRRYVECEVLRAFVTDKTEVDEQSAHSTAPTYQDFEVRELMRSFGFVPQYTQGKAGHHRVYKRVA